MSFSRQGFLVTSEIFQGQPSNKTLYETTLKKYQHRLKGTPDYTITDQGFRSQPLSRSLKPSHTFVWASWKTSRTPNMPFANPLALPQKALSPSPRPWRGFGKSLYQRIKRNQIWADLCQAAYNSHTFYQAHHVNRPINGGLAQ